MVLPELSRQPRQALPSTNSTRRHSGKAA
jgi:hypothetical protein